MKKNTVTLILFVLIGIIFGAIITQLLTQVQALRFLTHPASINWEPKADLQVLKYDFAIEIRLNLISLLSIIAAVWIHRKL